MSLLVRDPRLHRVVGERVEMETLGTGFAFTEGPVWHAGERHLTFSDMPGNEMRRWSEAKGVVSFRKPSDMANGLAYDGAMRLVICEHATSRVTRMDAAGRIEVLADRYEGKELNSPNDIIVAPDGAIYFTDPTFGRQEYYGVPREVELGFQGVYRIDPRDGGLTLLADDFGQPNGLCLSLDLARLYVNDTERAHIRVFDLGADGTLSGGRVWATLEGEGDGAADGMKIDRDGNLYCCGPGGIHVFAPDAACLGVIPVPEWTANFCWGSDDLQSLLITASTSLYRIRTKVPGRGF
jgi:gluconolactonase